MIDAPMEVKWPVMSTEGTDDEAADHVDAEEPIEGGDLLEDPRTDVEALCLCALLWSPTDTASDVSDLLRSTDFDRGVYGELFEVITAQVRSGAPHDPASIAATLTQSGRTGGHRGAQLTRALSSVTIAGAVPETVVPHRCRPGNGGALRGGRARCRWYGKSSILKVSPRRRSARQAFHCGRSALVPVAVSV